MNRPGPPPQRPPSLGPAPGLASQYRPQFAYGLPPAPSQAQQQAQQRLPQQQQQIPGYPSQPAPRAPPGFGANAGRFFAPPPQQQQQSQAQQQQAQMHAVLAAQLAQSGGGGGAQGGELDPNDFPALGASPAAPHAPGAASYASSATQAAQQAQGGNGAGGFSGSADDFPALGGEGVPGPPPGLNGGAGNGEGRTPGLLNLGARGVADAEKQRNMKLAAQAAWASPPPAASTPAPPAPAAQPTPPPVPAPAPPLAQTPAQQVLVSAADRWGLRALLALIKGGDGDAALLAIGTDLGGMGLELGGAANLYSAFATPWANGDAGAGEPSFTLPACYAVHAPPPGAQKAAAFSDETLFFMFYSAPRDALQELAALELFNRNWRFHRELRVWLTKEAGTAPSSKVPGGESGPYTVWDAQGWAKERREMTILYADLEEKAGAQAGGALGAAQAGAGQGQQGAQGAGQGGGGQQQGPPGMGMPPGMLARGF